MEKRGGQVLAASFLAGALAVATGLVVQGYARTVQYRRMLDNTHQRVFTELATATGKLNVALRKMTYATSPELFSTLYVQAYSKTLAAQSALGELPYGNVELEQAATFLTKTSGYAIALARDAYGKTAYTEAHRGTLCGLAEVVFTLFGALQSLLTKLDANTIRPEDVEAVQARLSNATESGGLPADSTFQTVKADLPEMPVLIYDGPSSDRLSGHTPKILEGLSQVSEVEAHRAAAAFLGLRKDIFTLSAQGEGRLLTWGFSALVNGDELYIGVTRQDGQVLQVLSSRSVSETSLLAQGGRQRAVEFLPRRGYQDIDPSYSIRRDGILTVHLASHQDDVYYYLGLVKVGMVLDTGDVMSFESEGYLMNHGDRTFPAPVVSEAEVAVQVNDSLTVLTHQLTLILTDGEYEVLCHEFRCQNASGGHVLVYVGAANGRQRRTLLPQGDENGTLVI